ncbi:uncharacterized protein PGTG_19516 [Puccinia graminis f. sp. tritici CRL 75-36-700-3]|uniref:Uncharacterized protein n=1 Tax=Puccinia graminis f. sp. tritici (strain CRL 75-36-700-3 / race SCCL) TaxID=418459 RepID=E3LAI7_PUCGT|nr:uncharacterized protein PGTG_19516 [Puccinia graminis f. sp. tritici CRL 75-36-700-3]EFP93562.2 hypothetical protein PGTG_19516 [Puccinia graminis f. sp. tritici CRL 75-36-700-3]
MKFSKVCAVLMMTNGNDDNLGTDEIDGTDQDDRRKERVEEDEDYYIDQGSSDQGSSASDYQPDPPQGGPSDLKLGVQACTPTAGQPPLQQIGVRGRTPNFFGVQARTPNFFGVQARTPICAWRAPWGLACGYQPPYVWHYIR